MLTQPPPPDAPAGNVISLDEFGQPRRRGRPRKIARAPDAHERARQEQVADRLRRHVAADPVVAVAARPSDRTSTETLDTTMRALAQEAASLGWEAHRAVLERRRDAERISSRRIHALTRIGDLLLERVRAGITEQFDPRDARVQTVVQHFIASARECADEVLGEGAAATFFEQVLKRAAGWENRLDE